MSEDVEEAKSLRSSRLRVVLAYLRRCRTTAKDSSGEIAAISGISQWLNVSSGREALIVYSEVAAHVQTRFCICTPVCRCHSHGACRAAEAASQASREGPLAPIRRASASERERASPELLEKHLTLLSLSNICISPPSPLLTYHHAVQTFLARRFGKYPHSAPSQIYTS